MSTIAAPGRSSDFRILGVIGIGHGMSHLFYLVLPPLFVHLREAFGVSYADLGMVLAAMSLTAAALQVASGFLVDRIGARVMLLSGFLLVSLSIAAMGFATSFGQLMLLAILAGLGNAVFHPTDYAILNSSISPERMGRAFSIHTFAGHVGSAAAPVVMIALAQTIGWRMALVAIGCAGLCALVLVASQWSVMREETQREPLRTGGSQESTDAPGPAPVWKIVLSPPMMLFFLFFAVLSMTQTGLQSFVATSLVALHGTPLATANLALSSYLFASAAGVLVGGEISDRTDRHDLVAGIVFAGSALVALLLAWFDLAAAMLVLLMGIMGLGQGVTRPARDMMLRAATPKGATGSVFGFVTSGIAVGSALAPVPLGWLLDIGRPAWVLYLIAAFMLLAIAAMVLQQMLTPRDRR